jgi:hypothetical protein
VSIFCLFGIAKGILDSKSILFNFVRTKLAKMLVFGQNLILSQKVINDYLAVAVKGLDGDELQYLHLVLRLVDRVLYKHRSTQAPALWTLYNKVQPLGSTSHLRKLGVNVPRFDLAYRSLSREEKSFISPYEQICPLAQFSGLCQKVAEGALQYCPQFLSLGDQVRVFSSPLYSHMRERADIVLTYLTRKITRVKKGTSISFSFDDIIETVGRRADYKVNSRTFFASVFSRCSYRELISRLWYDNRTIYFSLNESEYHTDHLGDQLIGINQFTSVFKARDRLLTLNESLDIPVVKTIEKPSKGQIRRKKKQLRKQLLLSQQNQPKKAQVSQKKD